MVTGAEVEAELKRIGHALKPFDIILVNTRASSCIGATSISRPVAAGAARRRFI